MSQICSLIFLPSISTVRILKSIPLERERGGEGGEGGGRGGEGRGGEGRGEGEGREGGGRRKRGERSKSMAKVLGCSAVKTRNVRNLELYCQRESNILQTDQHKQLSRIRNMQARVEWNLFKEAKFGLLNKKEAFTKSYPSQQTIANHRCTV